MTTEDAMKMIEELPVTLLAAYNAPSSAVSMLDDIVRITSQAREAALVLRSEIAPSALVTA